MAKPELAARAAAADTQGASPPGDGRLNPRRSNTKSSGNLAQPRRNIRKKHRSGKHPRHQQTQENVNDRATSTTRQQCAKSLQPHSSSTLLELVFYTLLCSTLTYPESPPKSHPNYIKRLHLTPPTQDEHPALNPPLAATTLIWNSWCCQAPNIHEWRQEDSLRTRPSQHTQRTTKNESKTASINHRYLQTLFSKILHSTQQHTSPHTTLTTRAQRAKQICIYTPNTHIRITQQHIQSPSYNPNTQSIHTRTSQRWQISTSTCFQQISTNTCFPSLSGYSIRGSAWGRYALRRVSRSSSRSRPSRHSSRY